jgi:hypothetical protein
MLDSWDDDQLLAALREAIAAQQAVPARLVESAKGAYAWHNVDAELAQLTYDSSRDRDRTAVVRSETASIRALTFTSSRLVIDLEVTREALLGQVVPPRRGTIEAETQTGTATTEPIDELGCFSVEPVPASPFRLHVRCEDGTDLVTSWITL